MSGGQKVKVTKLITIMIVMIEICCLKGCFKLKEKLLKVTFQSSQHHLFGELHVVNNLFCPTAMF